MIRSICLLILLFIGQSAFSAKKFTPPKTILVLDASNGRVLYEQNSKLKIFPASLTKVMTLYLLFDRLERSKDFNMKTKIPVSRRAANAPQSKLGLNQGESITVKDAILALAVRSANDVSVAVAEKLAKNETDFAQIMTKKAKQLGMRDTIFKNASGLHNPQHKTTARDLAKLFLAIKRDFPQYYKYLAYKNFEYKGRVVAGHDKVKENYDGVLGSKTGFTSKAGYNLMTTARRGNKTLLAVVTGNASPVNRNKKMTELLDKHFTKTVASSKTRKKNIGAN